MESFHGERNILFCLSLCDLINFLRDYKLWFQRILLRSPYLDVFGVAHTEVRREKCHPMHPTRIFKSKDLFNDDFLIVM